MITSIRQLALQAVRSPHFEMIQLAEKYFQFSDGAAGNDHDPRPIALHDSFQDRQYRGIRIRARAIQLKRRQRTVVVQKQRRARRNAEPVEKIP